MQVCEILQLVGDMISRVRWYFLISYKSSLIAAIRILFVSRRGGVIISVSGNQATVLVMRVADVTVTKT